MKKRNIAIIACFALGLFCSMGGLTSVNTVAETVSSEEGEVVAVSEETTVSYADVQADVEACCSSLTMDNGAAVRIKKDDAGSYVGSGIKFSASIDITETQISDWTATGVQFGVLVVPKDKLKTTDTNGTVGYAEVNEDWLDHKSAFNCVGAPILGESTYEIQGILTDLKVNHYVREYIGRAYIATPVEGADGTVSYNYHFAKYYGNDVANNTRSIYYVTQLAQEADATSPDAQSAKALYMDSTESQEYYASKLYKVTVNHHYGAKDGTVETVTEVQGGALNSTMRATTLPKAGFYLYDSETTNGQDVGTVYPSGRQTLNVYYKEGDVTEKVTQLFSEADGSQKYSGGTLEVNESGALVSTSANSENIVFTAEFIYALQQAGCTKLTFESVSCPAKITGLFQVARIEFSGYYSQTFTDNVKDGVKNLTINLENKLTPVTDAEGKVTYIDENGVTVTGIQIDAWKRSIFGGAETQLAGAQWELSGMEAA